MTQLKTENQNQGDSQDEAGKLFVGGLSWETTQETLQSYFGRYGEVVDCVVMKNNETGRSRGFGFVTFKDPNCVAKVLSSGPHELDSRTIDPKACSARGAHKMKKSGNYPKVFLGGLPTACTETDIRSFFSKYGRVMEVVIMYDQEKKKSRGFGFLSFETEDSVKQVCAEHFVTINNKQVECKRAGPRDMSRNNRAQQQNNNMGQNQWGSNMGMGTGPGAWGTGPSGPGMGPGGPSMGGGPSGMGPGMANGMMAGGYQGGWGGPQQQAPYGPQAGWGPQAQAGWYGTGYQGWGAPGGGYGPYGGPGPQFGQQGYGGYGAPYGGYGGGQMGGGGGTGGPSGTQPPGTDGYGGQGGSGPGPNNSAPSGPAGGGSGSGPNAQQGMGNYQQDSSNFGPARGGGGGGGGGYGGGFGGPGAGGYGGQGDVSGPQAGRGGGQAQGYHPYRR